MADPGQGLRRSARIQQKLSTLPPLAPSVMASGNLKRKNQQASSAAKSQKKAKASATTSGKGKARAVSPPPPPDVQHVAITELKTLNQVVEHFALHHRRTDPPRDIPDEINPYIWPITDTRVEGWLLDKLGPGIIHELDLAVEKGSALSEFIFKYQSCVYSDTEASTRPVVDLILLAAISIVNGTSTIYREQLKGAPTEGMASGAGEMNREYVPQEGPLPRQTHRYLLLPVR